MVEIIRTDDVRFENLKDWPYEAKYKEIDTEYGNIRIHYIDEGSENSDTILLIPVSYTHLTLPTILLV